VALEDDPADDPAVVVADEHPCRAREMLAATTMAMNGRRLERILLVTETGFIRCRSLVISVMAAPFVFADCGHLA